MVCYGLLCFDNAFAMFLLCFVYVLLCFHKFCYVLLWFAMCCYVFRGPIEQCSHPSWHPGRHAACACRTTSGTKARSTPSRSTTTSQARSSTRSTTRSTTRRESSRITRRESTRAPISHPSISPPWTWSLTAWLSAWHTIRTHVQRSAEVAELCFAMFCYVFYVLSCFLRFLCFAMFVIFCYDSVCFVMFSMFCYALLRFVMFCYVLPMQVWVHDSNRCLWMLQKRDLVGLNNDTEPALGVEKWGIPKVGLGAMFCYVLLCFVMFSMFYYVLLCFAMTFYLFIMFCYVFLSFAMFRYVFYLLLCFAMFFISCYVLLCFVMFFYFCHVQVRPVLGLAQPHGSSATTVKCVELSSLPQFT